MDLALWGWVFFLIGVGIAACWGGGCGWAGVVDAGGVANTRLLGLLVMEADKYRTLSVCICIRCKILKAFRMYQTKRANRKWSVNSFRK
jgi:hypothetical protein